MKDNLNNTGNENIKTENIKEHSKEALQSLKKDYYKADMSETQFNRLKLVMEQAKKESWVMINSNMVSRLTLRTNPRDPWSVYCTQRVTTRPSGRPFVIKN